MKMTKSELIEKAKKIAARMNSPCQHEVEVAAAMLKKLLDDHNMSMLDIGLKPMTSNNLVNADIRIDISEESLMDINYKKGCTVLPNWAMSMIRSLSRIMGFRVIFYPGYTKIVGLGSDIAIAKLIIVHLSRYIENRIALYRFPDNEHADGYGLGLSSQVLMTISASSTENVALSRAKWIRIAKYVAVRYGILFDEPGKGTFSYNVWAYQKGQSDGNSFRIPGGTEVRRSDVCLRR